MNNKGEDRQISSTKHQPSLVDEGTTTAGTQQLLDINQKRKYTYRRNSAVKKDSSESRSEDSEDEPVKTSRSDDGISTERTRKRCCHCHVAVAFLDAMKDEYDTAFRRDLFEEFRAFLAKMR